MTDFQFTNITLFQAVMKGSLIRKYGKQKIIQIETNDLDVTLNIVTCVQKYTISL